MCTLMTNDKIIQIAVIVFSKNKSAQEFSLSLFCHQEDREVDIFSAVMWIRIQGYKMMGKAVFD